MKRFILTWPRAKGAILLGLASFALLMLGLVVPGFMPPFAFDTISMGQWAFFGGTVVLLLMGIKMAFVPRLIIRCSEEGVFIPQYGTLIPWNNVVSIASSRMKVAATQPNKPGSVGESRYADAIRITFDNTITLSTRFQHNDYRAETPTMYRFSAEMSRLSAEEIVSVLNTLKEAGTSERL